MTLHDTVFHLAEPVSTFIGLTALIETIIGGSAIAIGSLTISAAAIGGFLLTTAAVVALNVISGLSASAKPQALTTSGQITVQEAAGALTVSSRVAVANRQNTMGRVLRSGTLFFEAVLGPYLYRGYILANHKIGGVDEIRIGTTALSLDRTGKANTSPYFDGTTCFLQVSIRTGDDDQEIDPILAADFKQLDRSFRQRGIATAVVKLYRGSTAAVANKIWGSSDPNFIFVVRGKKFYDPREPSQTTTDKTTWTWTNNAALCTAGWLNDADGGNVDWSFIDLDRLRAAADVCDQKVSRLDGTVESRYEINGVSDTTTDPNQTLNDLMLSMIGEYALIDGKYALFAGAPRDTNGTLTESSARGTLDVTTERSWQDYVNTVSTSFVAKNREYAVATGPVYQDADAVASDGTTKSTTVQLPFVTSETQVQRICKYVIRRSQLGGTLQRGENIEGMRRTATDIVRVEYTGGLSSLNGNWEVVHITEANRIDEYVLQLAQYDGQFLYGWDPSVDERDWTQSDLNLSG